MAGIDCGAYPCTAVVVFAKEAMPHVSCNINDDPVVYETRVDGVAVGEFETLEEAQDLAEQRSFEEAAKERWPNMSAQSYGRIQESSTSYKIAFLAEPVEPLSAERKRVDFLLNEAAKTFAEDVQGAKDQLEGELELGEGETRQWSQ